MTVVTETAFKRDFLPLAPGGRVHLIGIGGIGMSGLARILLARGFTVSGSDLLENPAQNPKTRTLVEHGAQVFEGHEARNVPEGALVVLSTAIDPQNPELVQAQKMGLAVCHRSQLLKVLLEGQTGKFPLPGHDLTIGVTGTHGKTTITGLMGSVLKAARLDPTVVAGGLLPGYQTNVWVGPHQRYAVAELDESDGSLCCYRPDVTILSNLELDHVDQYPGGFEEIRQTLRGYLASLLPREGRPRQVVMNIDCPELHALADHAPATLEVVRVSCQGLHSEEADFWLSDIQPAASGGYCAQAYSRASSGVGLLGTLETSIPGQHNLWNALLVVATGDRLGIPFDLMAEALKNFSGMGRRFEPLGTLNGAWLVDDYAHHPTEVAATLAATRQKMKAQGLSGKLVAIFEPHRYSRLKTFWTEFLHSFGAADMLYVTDVYSAHEPKIEGVSAETFCEELLAQPADQRPATVLHLPNATWETFRKTLATTVQPGDLWISLGAGKATTLLRNLSEAPP